MNDAISLYPNPVSDELFIRFDGTPGDNLTMEVYNVQGQKVHSASLVNVTQYDQRSIDVSQLDKGMYIIRFISDKGYASKQFIVK